MRTLAAIGVLAALALAAHPARAQDKPGLTVTVYNQGYGVIKDDRLLDLQNDQPVKVTDVAQYIDPTSVYFLSLTDPEGTRVLEQNYEFDLVNADKLLEKYIDKELIVFTREATQPNAPSSAGFYQGVLQSFDASQLVLKTKDGLVMVQRPDNITNIRFPALPEGLLTKPTLVWTVAAKKPGQQLVRLAYQTSAMEWRADYNVVSNEDDTKVDINGWVTVTNNSGATYKDARLKLIAGDVRRAETPAPRATAAARRGADLFGGGAMPAEKAFFEYHMYTFPNTTTLVDHQVKQLQYLQAAGVAVNKVYLYQGLDVPFFGNIVTDRDFGRNANKKVKVYIELENTKANHLGEPLPAGKVRVYKKDKDDNSLEFVGEDSIDHTKVTDKVKLYVGNAFDINGERKVLDFQIETGRKWMQEKVQITLTNAKETPIAVKVEEKLSRGHNWKISEESDKYAKDDANTVNFVVPVDARQGDTPGKKVITYTVEYTW